MLLGFDPRRRQKFCSIKVPIGAIILVGSRTASNSSHKPIGAGGFDPRTSVLFGLIGLTRRYYSRVRIRIQLRQQPIRNCNSKTRKNRAWTCYYFKLCSLFLLFENDLRRFRAGNQRNLLYNTVPASASSYSSEPLSLVYADCSRLCRGYKGHNAKKRLYKSYSRVAFLLKGESIVILLPSTASYHDFISEKKRNDVKYDE